MATSYGQPVVTYQWDESGALPRLLGCTAPLAIWQFGYLLENDGRLPDTVILTGPVIAKLGYWDLKSLQCKLGYDYLGTVKLIADPFNELVKELVYDSFGNIISETEQQIYFPLGFAGGLRDIATGFVSFGYRDYDPSVGRFTTPDPAWDMRGDGDIYDYCVDDPVNLVDVEGLQFTSAEAASAARKGHKGISHPFGEKHETASVLRTIQSNYIRNTKAAGRANSENHDRGKQSAPPKAVKNASSTRQKKTYYTEERRKNIQSLQQVLKPKLEHIGRGAVELDGALNLPGWLMIKGLQWVRDRAVKRYDKKYK